MELLPKKNILIEHFSAGKKKEAAYAVGMGRFPDLLGVSANIS